MNSIINEIKKLKKEKNAVILAHNYQRPEIQDVADHVGDSLELAIQAKAATAETIVICGVQFMAETAKILNQNRKVLIPVMDAGCPLADYLTPEMIQEARKKHPGAMVVLYINSRADCKAEADITCTSGNAVKVVKSLPSDTVLFGPDSNLASYVQRCLPEKKIIPLPPEGHCYVHTEFCEEDIAKARQIGGKIICHPECPEKIQLASDEIASTGGMLDLVEKEDLWNVFTEKDMVYRLRKLFPDKKFFETETAVCKDMKKITQESLLLCLKTGKDEIILPKELMKKASDSIEKMIAVGR